MTDTHKPGAAGNSPFPSATTVTRHVCAHCGIEDDCAGPGPHACPGCGELMAPAAPQRAPAVRYVKRGRFRLPEPAPDHVQAAWGGLPVHGLPATTVRELLLQMAGVMLTMDYRRRHSPDETIGEACRPWMAHYAAQAKALLWAARDVEEIPLPLPVLQPVVVSADDCRARFLELYADGRLSSALDGGRLSDAEARKAMSESAYRLFEDMRHAGVVRGVGAGEA